MDNQLFRQKSIDRISSPEELHDYMRVTSPRLWMILGAIVVLLAGFIVYASTVTLENTVDIMVYTDDDETAVTGDMFYYSYLQPSMQGAVSTGMVVRIGDESGKVNQISIRGDGRVKLIIKMDNTQYDLPDGAYSGVLVLEKTTPVSFLWNH